MRPARLLAVLALSAALAGCGAARRKAADHYLDKAAAVAAQTSPSPEDLERAYRQVGKAFAFRGNPARAFEVLDALSERANAAGFIRGRELRLGVLKNCISSDPHAWPAYAEAINALGLSGDMLGLGEIEANLEKVAAGSDPLAAYQGALGRMFAAAALLPWVEADGYLALGRSAGAVTGRAEEYSRLTDQVAALREAAEKAEPKVKLAADPKLVSFGEVAASAALRDGELAARIKKLLALMDAEPGYKRALALTVDGNARLLARDHKAAREFYNAALKEYPALVDARKGLVETDFQQGAALAVDPAREPEAKTLLYRAYEESEDVIEAALETGPMTPFTRRDKFLSEIYALKAAVMSAVNAIEKGKLRNRYKMEQEFKAAMDSALRYDPKGKLARDLLELYGKQGF